MRYKDYLPDIFREIEDYSFFGTAADRYLLDLFEKTEGFCEEVNLFSMTENLFHWEKILGIDPGGKTLEERRKAVLSRLNIRLPYTKAQLKNQLDTLFPSGDAEVETEEGYSLKIGVSDSFKSFPETLRRQLRQAIPANLTLEIYEIHKEDTETRYQLYLQTADIICVEERS